MNVIRNYVFIPSGETVRAAELVVITAIAESIREEDVLTLINNPKAILLPAAIAGVMALWAFIKGKLPPKPVTP